MKSLAASIYSLAILLLTSTTALAHSGHLPDEPWHGFLHVEHVIVFAVIGFLVYVLKASGKK